MPGKTNAVKKPKPHYVGHRERLRKRFLSTDGQGFADYEILELLLTFVIPRKDVKPAAKTLIKRLGSIKGIMDSQPESLVGIKGIGEKTAIFIKALRAIMRRYFELEAEQTQVLDSTEAVISYCRASLEAEPKEVFEVLFVSPKNRLIKTERLFQGTIDRAAVYPREVIKSALDFHAAALICVHNHPSGDPTPSPEDEKLTGALFEAARAVGITLHDHIIIGKGKHFSFRANGLLAVGN